MRKACIWAAVAACAAAWAADTPITNMTVADTLVAALRFQGQYTDVGKYMEELMAAVGDKNAGPYMALYYDTPEAPVHDIEVCVPVKEAVEKGNVKSRTLPGGTFARAVHLGPYDKIGETWMKLSSVVQMNGLGGEGPGREVYVLYDDKNAANNITEILIPVSQPVEEAAKLPSSRVVHFEIPADDPGRAVAFYTKAFGWKIQKWDDADYWLCMTGSGPGIDGAIYKRAPGDVTRNAVAVEDLDAAGKAVEAAGGKVVTPKMPVPQVGWLAYYADTEGNVFGMMQFDPAVK